MWQEREGWWSCHPEAANFRSFVYSIVWSLVSVDGVRVLTIKAASTVDGRNIARQRKQNDVMDFLSTFLARYFSFFRTRRRRRRTSNVRLPLKLSSDQRETSATRVSEDLQLSTFLRQNFLFSKIFGSKNQIFVNLVRFRRTYSRMDVKINFLVKFRSR